MTRRYGGTDRAQAGSGKAWSGAEVASYVMYQQKLEMLDFPWQRLLRHR